MSAREKSDLPKVAEKRANKVASAAAELAERRGGAKENAELRAAVSQAQSRIRETVIRNRRDKLTALLHHLTVDVLRASFFGLKKFAAPDAARKAVPRHHPRWEPGALTAPAGICAGGGEQSLSPRPPLPAREWHGCWGLS